MWFNTPECNLNWMMIVCKSMQVTRPMSANLYISSLKKNTFWSLDKYFRKQFEWWLYASQHNLTNPRKLFTHIHTLTDSVDGMMAQLTFTIYIPLCKIDKNHKGSSQKAKMESIFLINMSYWYIFRCPMRKYAGWLQQLTEMEMAALATASSGNLKC